MTITRHGWDIFHANTKRVSKWWSCSVELRICLVLVIFHKINFIVKPGKEILTTMKIYGEACQGNIQIKKPIMITFGNNDTSIGNLLMPRGITQPNSKVMRGDTALYMRGDKIIPKDTIFRATVAIETIYVVFAY